MLDCMYMHICLCENIINNYRKYFRILVNPLRIIYKKAQYISYPNFFDNTTHFFTKCRQEINVLWEPIIFAYNLNLIDYTDGTILFACPKRKIHDPIEPIPIAMRNKVSIIREDSYRDIQISEQSIGDVRLE